MSKSDSWIPLYIPLDNNEELCVVNVHIGDGEPIGFFVKTTQLDDFVKVLGYNKLNYSVRHLHLI